jgi:hypothetical protein
MTQKTQWTMAATALAAGVLLLPAAHPAHAQIRIHLTGPVVNSGGGGIVRPPSSPSSPGIVRPPSTTTQPAVSNQPQPVQSPAPVAVPSSQPLLSSRSSGVVSPIRTIPSPAPVVRSSPQGFSAGPGILGAPRIPEGQLVNRVGPDIDGDGIPDIHKLPLHR